MAAPPGKTAMSGSCGSTGLARLCGLIVALVLLLTLAFLIAAACGFTDETWLRDRLLALTTAPAGRPLAAATIGLLLAADLVLPVPSSVLMTLSGYLCGAPVGGAVNFLGAMASACLGFWTCRRFGRRAFRRFIDEGEVPRVERFIETWGAWGILLSRSVPMLTEVVSCVAGLGSMTWRRFLILCIAGTLPISYVYAHAGARSQGDPSLAWPLLLAFGLPAAGFAVLLLLRRGLASRDPDGNRTR